LAKDIPPRRDQTVDKNMDLPDWISVGERVAVEVRDSWFKVTGYETRVVDRLTPAMIVLTDGRKFSRMTLERVGQRGATLVDRRDVKVRTYRANRLLSVLAKDIMVKVDTEVTRRGSDVADTQQYIRDRVAKVLAQVDTIMDGGA
jgi:hypothetical protein